VDKNNNGGPAQNSVQLGYYIMSHVYKNKIKNTRLSNENRKRLYLIFNVKNPSSPKNGHVRLQ